MAVYVTGDIHGEPSRLSKDSFYEQKNFSGNKDENIKYDVSSFEELIANARNKAIDDFVKFANTMPTVESEDGTIRPMWLEEIAEQLKAGVKNEWFNQ